MKSLFEKNDPVIEGLTGICMGFPSTSVHFSMCFFWIAFRLIERDDKNGKVIHQTDWEKIQLSAQLSVNILKHITR